MLSKSCDEDVTQLPFFYLRIELTFSQPLFLTSLAAPYSNKAPCSASKIGPPPPSSAASNLVSSVAPAGWISVKPTQGGAFLPKRPSAAYLQCTRSAHFLCVHFRNRRAVAVCTRFDHELLSYIFPSRCAFPWDYRRCSGAHRASSGKRGRVVLDAGGELRAEIPKTTLDLKLQEPSLKWIEGFSCKRRHIPNNLACSRYLSLTQKTKRCTSTISELIEHRYSTR